MPRLIAFKHTDFETAFFINPDHVRSVRPLRADDDEAFAVITFADGAEATVEGSAETIVDKLNGGTTTDAALHRTAP